MGQYNFYQDLKLLEKEKMITLKLNKDNQIESFEIKQEVKEDNDLLNYVKDILMRTPKGCLLLFKS